MSSHRASLDVGPKQVRVLKLCIMRIYTNSSTCSRTVHHPWLDTCTRRLHVSNKSGGSSCSTLRLSKPTPRLGQYFGQMFAISAFTQAKRQHVQRSTCSTNLPLRGANRRLLMLHVNFENEFVTII